MNQTPPERSAAFTDPSVPEAYEQRLAPVIFEPWAEQLLDRVGIDEGDRALDVATGTGVVARAAARRAGPAGAVVATDISAAMLAQATTHPVTPDAAAIEYVGGPAEQLPLEDRSFGVVLCQQSIQFFTDKLAALTEMRRVTHPGGRLGLAVWAAGQSLDPFDAYLKALEGLGVPPPFPGAFEISSFWLDEDELSTLLGDAGYEAVEIAVCERTAVWPDASVAADGIMGTPFGPLAAGLPADRRAALDAELREHFAPASPREPVRHPMVALIARARTAAETGTPA
jgi:SAM-dependent methyltransferase